MSEPASTRERFLDRFGVWPEAAPFIEMMVLDEEMDLVVALDGDACTVDEVAPRLGLDPAATADVLDRAWRRHVVHRKSEDGIPRYESAGFPARLDHVVKYENWDDVPEPDRRVLDRLYLDEFIGRHRDNVLARMRGEDVESRLPNDAVLLLDEAVEMVRTAEVVSIQPCDCRRLGERCKRPHDVCFLFDDVARHALERGYSEELTIDEAVERLRYADKKGLMHTADAGWRDHGRRYLCNCCADDCYPFRAAAELGSKGVWPEVRYVAVHDEAACQHCAICVGRCHFDAFERTPVPADVPGKPRKRVRFHAERCWGCGLCANSCPDDAIEMVALGHAGAAQGESHSPQ